MARQELQVELRKLEGDYEQKLQDLSQEKELLASSKQEQEKEIHDLQKQQTSLKQQVHMHTVISLTYCNTEVMYHQHTYLENLSSGLLALSLNK